MINLVSEKKNKTFWRAQIKQLAVLLILIWCLAGLSTTSAQPPETLQAPVLMAQEQTPAPSATPVDYEHPEAEHVEAEHEDPLKDYRGSGHSSTKTKIFFGILLALIIGIMSAEVVDKSIVTMLGAITCLAFAYSPIFELLRHDSGGHGHPPFYAYVVDWSTIGVIIGTSIFVEIASRSGIFTWSALKLTKMSKGDPYRLLVLYSVLTVLFSAFLNNVTAMIIVGSLTVVSCQRLELKVLPYLFIEGLLTNVGGLLTLISSIPNIIVGNTAGISFAWFFVIASPYVVLATWVTIMMGKRKFETIEKLESEEAIKEAQERVEEFDENEVVTDRKFFVIAWLGMIAVILGFALQSYLPVLSDMGLEAVALGAAVLFLLLFAPHKVEEALNTVEWSLVLFFASLFVIIGVMELAGVLEAIGDGLEVLLGLGGMLATTAVTWSAAIASSVTDNIPLAVVLAKILSLKGADPNSSYWWAVIFGANLGGNITPIGSASTVVAMTVIKRQNVELSFLGFVKMALPFAIIQLILATVYLGILSGLGMVVNGLHP
jgi:Na+/H+ antiporter NhaD/arsenite permease-like protein